MTISIARLEDMSIQHWVRGIILPKKWIERVENVPLTFHNTSQSYRAEIVWLPNFLDEGRGWVYFDATSSGSCVLTAIPAEEQTNQITVYNEIGGAINPGFYQINYSQGAITTSGTGTTPTTTPDGTPTTIDFAQYYVSTIDGWPGTEPPALPLIAIELAGYKKEPFQLGGGRKANRSCTFHIFSTSSAERDDLTEFLHDALFQRHIPVLDFRNGEPLNYDGTFNKNFTGDILVLNNNDDALFYFEDIRVEYINLRLKGDYNDLNRWRSKISFRWETYRDGIDFNAL